MVARDSYGEWPTPTETTRMLSNIVMMGMGEPLYNFDNVATALKIVMDEQGIALLAPAHHRSRPRASCP